MKGKFAVLQVFFVVALAIFSVPNAKAHVGVSEEEWLNDPHDHGDAKIVYLKAYQFGFAIKAIQEGSKIKIYPEGEEPSILEVNQGDKVVFRIISEDVTHGFYIDGYSPPPSEQKVMIVPGEIVEVGPITFDRPGKFKLRCSVTCGPLHPFMISEVKVSPNVPYYALLISAIGLSGIMLAYLRRGPKDKMLGISLRKEIDLLSVRGIGPLLKRFLQWRGFHYTVIVPNLFFFLIVIVAGLVGNPVGNKNFAIAVVWILWFAAVEFMILFGARTWCTICPLPALGEWLARRRLYGVHKVRKWFSLNLKWPTSINNMWIGALFFLAMSLLIPWLVTRPVVTSMLFILLIGMATVLYVTHPPRNFCRSICPAGAYIGHDSVVSFYSVRVKDRELCNKHKAKECIRGSPTGYGCPWRLYPGGNDENTYCGQCYECLRSCPLDNMTVKLRMIGKDLAHIATKAKNKFDEAWMGFIRFTLGAFYMLVFFGPFSWFRDWGNMGVEFGANLATIGLLKPELEGVVNWFKWALVVASISIIIYPAIFYAFSWLSKRVSGESKIPTKQLFLAFSYSLVPYIVFVWFTFAVSILLVFWAYPISVLSDPFGWGWNLLGIKLEWTPIIPDWLVFVQAPFILLGMAMTIHATYNIAREVLKDHSKAFRATSVMSVLHLLATFALIWIIAG